MERPYLSMTFGPMPAPEVAFDPLSKGFWLTWRSENATLDLILRDRDELRALVRAALEAAGEGHETHAVASSG